jgi:hypothetical protein
LWRVTTIVTLPQKPIFDLRVNPVQPLLSALGLLSATQMHSGHLLRFGLDFAKPSPYFTGDVLSNA